MDVDFMNEDFKKVIDVTNALIRCDCDTYLQLKLMLLNHTKSLNRFWCDIFAVSDKYRPLLLEMH